MRVARQLDELAVRQPSMVSASLKLFQEEHKELKALVNGAELTAAVKEAFTAAPSEEPHKSEQLQLDVGLSLMSHGFDLLRVLHTTERLTVPGLPLESGAAILEELESSQSSTLNIVTQRLDDIARSVEKSMSEVPGLGEASNSHPAAMAIHHINKVLYDQMEFKGNTEDYYSPQNSCLTQVPHSRP